VRLDQRLVELGLAASRARALIEAGAVTVGGAVAQKPTQTVGPGAEVTVTAEPNPWVLVGGAEIGACAGSVRPDAAGGRARCRRLDRRFHRGPAGARAERVYALDVGHGQLHPRIAADPRVVNLEGANIRAIPARQVPPVDWITVDVSFISLTKALPAALIKPQFEAGRAAVGKGGIVRDPAVHAAVRARIRAWLEGQGWQVTGEAPSPIEGSDGNREFLIAARKPEY